MNFDLFRAVPGRLAATEDSRMPCARPDRRGFRHDDGSSPLARWLAAALVPLAALALGSAAQANTLAVTATVAAACTTSGGTIPFGTYNPAQNTDVQPTFAITCTNGATVNIHLDQGLHVESDNRHMSNGSGGFLMYQLFQDSGRSIAWGNNESGEFKAIPSYNQATHGTQQVFARIPAGQASVAPGDYTDTVGISFTF